MLSYLNAGNNNLDSIICRHVLCCNFSYLLCWQVAKCFANDLGQIIWERFCDKRCSFKQMVMRDNSCCLGVTLVWSWPVFIYLWENNKETRHWNQHREKKRGQQQVSVGLTGSWWLLLLMFEDLSTPIKVHLSGQYQQRGNTELKRLTGAAWFMDPGWGCRRGGRNGGRKRKRIGVSKNTKSRGS